MKVDDCYFKLLEKDLCEKTGDYVVKCVGLVGSSDNVKLMFSFKNVDYIRVTGPMLDFRRENLENKHRVAYKDYIEVVLKNYYDMRCRVFNKFKDRYKKKGVCFRELSSEDIKIIRAFKTLYRPEMFSIFFPVVDSLFSPSTSSYDEFKEKASNLNLPHEFGERNIHMNDY